MKLIRNATEDKLKQSLKELDEAKGKPFTATRPNIITVSLKRLTTFDGLGSAQNCKIGDTFYLDLNQIGQYEITNADGRKHQKTMVGQVDAFGQPKGMIYTELFFNDAKFLGL